MTENEIDTGIKRTNLEIFLLNKEVITLNDISNYRSNGGTSQLIIKMKDGMIIKVRYDKIDYVLREIAQYGHSFFQSWRYKE